MAFALTKFRAYGVQRSGTGRRHLQRAVLDITGLAADVALDIGTDAGTFWTAAKADGTYGDLATSALADLQDIVQNGKLIGYTVNSLFDRVQAASASGAAYAVAIANERPNITMAANEGETAYTVTLEYELNNDQLPVAVEYGG